MNNYLVTFCGEKQAFRYFLAQTEEEAIKKAYEWIELSGFDGVVDDVVEMGA